ncbi:unnamed protein product [Colias eurytheme]|nr:unnamed protein product [Colias eurytheme]
MVPSFDIEKLHLVPERMSTFSNIFAYFKTKLCINLMTIELARRLQGTGVTVNCVHPGAVSTNLVDEIDITPLKLMLKINFMFFRSPWEGAQTVNYLAVSPEVENCSGGYYVECKLGNPSGRAQNVELAQKFWEATERLIRR